MSRAFSVFHFLWKLPGFFQLFLLFWGFRQHLFAVADKIYFRSICFLFMLCFLFIRLLYLCFLVIWLYNENPCHNFYFFCFFYSFSYIFATNFFSSKIPARFLFLVTFWWNCYQHGLSKCLLGLSILASQECEKGLLVLRVKLICLHFRVCYFINRKAYCGSKHHSSGKSTSIENHATWRVCPVSTKESCVLLKKGRGRKSSWMT